MINKKFICLIILFIFFVSTSEAADYFNFLYHVKEGDTFSSILKQFVKPDAQISGSTPLVNKIIKKNPIVKDWKNLGPGISLQLYISPDLFDYEKYRNYEAINIANLKLQKKVIEKGTEAKSGWKGSAFYMYSTGTLTQQNVGTSISSSRNSPFTAGVSFNYLPIDQRYSLAASAYICLLTSSNNNIDGSIVANPIELGGNIYGEYRFLNKKYNIYSGLDFETLSGYNLNSLEDDQKIYVENSKILFLTFGISNFFTIYNLPLFTKLSFSKSIISTYDGGAPVESPSSMKYSGFKALFYLNYKFTDKIFLHSMVKYHSLSGPSELRVLRVGIGVGYILF